MIMQLTKIVFKLIKILIKIFIVLFFIFSILLWIVFFILLMVHNFEINFMLMSSCLDFGAGWDMENKGCRWL
jgi:hypothetical protein